MTAEKIRVRKRTRRDRPLSAKQTREFWFEALTAGERLRLPVAERMEGIDQEVAVLRTKLVTACKEHPEDFALMTRGMDMLVKAVAAQYRLSPKAGQELSEHIAGVIDSVGALLAPGVFSE